MAVELKSRGVTSVSLWPGAVQTELVSQFVLEQDTVTGINSKVDASLQKCIFLVSVSFRLMSEFSVPQFKDVFANGETTELSGKCIVNLAKGGIILCETVFAS